MAKTVRDPFATLVDALDAHGCRPRRKSARCPAHDDHNPSLTFAAGDDGRALVYCHAGCTVEAIVAALGLELRDLFPNRASYRRARRAGHDPLIVNVLGRHVAAPAKSCDGLDVPELADVDRAVLRILHDHAFFAPTCCPSQQLIGAEAEEILGRPLSQPTVFRALCRLRARGLIDWRHEFAPGARFYHNVYTLLAHWCRPFRQAVIARIRAARDRLSGRSLSRVNSKSTARDVVKKGESHARAAGTLNPHQDAPRTRHGPPSEEDWQQAFEALSTGAKPRCAILGAD